MRKITLLFFAILMTAFSWQGMAQVIPIGTGTSTQVYPLGNYYGFERSSAIYTASEIGVNGNISALSWYANTGDEGARPIKVYLKETSSTSHPTSMATWADEIDGATLVYEGSIDPATGWYTIYLPTSFDFSSDNLKVLVEANIGGSGLTGSSGNSIRYSSVTDSHAFWRGDSSAPTGNGTRTSSRPNIQLDFSAPPPNCSGTPDGGVATVTPISGEDGVEVLMSATGYEVFSLGISYQWEFKFNDNAWQQLGGVSSTYEDAEAEIGGVPGDMIEIRLEVACSHSSQTSYSTSAFFEITPPANYCIPAYTSTGDYLSEVSSDGALTDMSYNSSVQPTGGYADETAQTFEAYETLEFDINTTYKGGSNGVKIWVDWNNDNYFAPSEVVAYEANTSLTKTLSVTIPDNTPEGDYRMRVHGKYGTTAEPDPCESSNWGSAVDFTLTIVAPPSCLGPAQLAATNITDSSVDLSWIENGDATQWEVIYGEADFDPLTGTPETVNTDPETTITGLSANSTYDFYVTAICGVGDESEMVGPMSFTTLCDSIASLPYTEEFDTYGTGSDAFPSCWIRPLTYTSGTIWPSIVSGNATSSPNSLKFQSAVGTPTYAVSPAFAEDIQNLRVSFMLKREGTSSGTIDIGVMNDPLDLTTFELVQTIDPDNNNFNPYSFDLNATLLTGGNNHIAFRHNSILSNWFYWLDDFTVEPIPSCIAPSDLVIDNVTTNSAGISWTEGPTETQWEVIYGVSPFDPLIDGITIPVNTDSETTLSGLTHSTSYDVYVKAICGTNDESTLVGPITFTTLCDPIASLPYTEEFDTYGTGSDAFPSCWIRPVTYTSGTIWPSIVLGNATSSPNSLKFQSAVGTPTYAVSPAFAEDIQNLRVSFMLKREGPNSGTMDIGVMTDPLDITTFELVQTIEPVDNLHTAYSFDLNATLLTGGNNHIAFRHNSILSNWFYWVDDFTVEPIPSCIAPSDLVIDNVTTNNAGISWTTDASQSDIYVVEAGEPAPDENITPTDSGVTSPATWNGLDSSTTYDVYVRADCGTQDGVSEWEGPVVFTTLCVSVSDFSEGFEDTTASDFPNCWAKVGSTGSVYPQNNTGITGARNLYMYNGATVAMPTVNNASDGTHQVVMNVRGNLSSGETIELGHLPDPSDANSFVFISSIVINSSTVPQEFLTIPTGMPAGDVVFALRTVGAVSVLIDDVSWEAIPSCPAPTDLTLAYQTLTSVDLEWTLGDSEAAWNISWGTPGYTPGDVGQIDIASASAEAYQITGLTADTHYDIYVQSDCGLEGESIWVGPLAVFTGYCIPTGSSNNGDEIRNFTLSNLDNDSSASEGTDGYSDYTSSVLPAELQAGVPYQASLTSGSGSGNHGAAIWIDYDQNGVFEASEMVSFIASSIGANATVIFPEFIVPAATPQTTYRLRVQYHYSKDGNLLEPCLATSSYSETEDYAITVLAPPSCPAPSDLLVSNITTDSADVNWTAGTTETEWEVKYGDVGFDPLIEGTTVSASDDSETTINNLDHSTTYEVYVRAVCDVDDESAWVGPESFTTLCSFATVPYIMDFEDATVPDLPACTSREKFGSVSDWITTSNPGYGFTSKVLERGYDSSNDSDAWFYTQGIELVAGTEYEISYKYGNDNQFSDTEKMKLAYGTSPEVAQMTIQLDDHPSITGGVPIVNTVTFTPVTNDVYYFGFHSYSDSGNWKMYLDDISVIKAPVLCDAVTDVAISDITDATATVTWTAVATATEGYTVNVYAEGADITSATTVFTEDVVVGGTTVEVDGLDPETEYDVYVVSDCDGETAISAVVTFTTEAFVCDAVTDVVVSDESFTTATVTWVVSATANDGYIVNVYEEGADITTATAVFTEVIADETTTTSAVTGLASGTAYDVYVTSVCDTTDNITAISTVVTFTTASCDAVTNILASAVDYTTATLTWDGATSAADGYLVEVYAENADTTTATPVFDGNVAAGIETVDVIGLEPNTDYDVYITSICDETDNITTVSDVYTFSTIEVVCEAVTELTVSTTTETTATVSWTASASATEGYVVNVYEAGTTNVVAAETLLDGNTTTVEVTGLTADTDYDVTVTSDCGFNETEVSDTVAFSTEGCNAVTGVIATNIGHATTTIEWTEAAIPAANGYTIEVYETGTTTDVDATATAAAGETSAAITGLWPETAYDVYVTSDCGYATAIADVHTFTTIAITCDPVTNLMADAITETSATLSWDASASATEGYVVEVYVEGEVRGQDTPAFSNTLTAGTTTVEVTGLTPDTVYEVYLDADCDFGIVATATIEFTTEGCSEVTNLTITGVTQTTAMINWDEPAIPAADGYVVEVYEAGADVETATVVFESTALTGATSIEATGLWPDTDYDVYVTSDCGYDTATAVMDTFTTEAVVCDAVTGITITDETPTGATLSWTDTATAVNGYVVEVYEAGADVNTATTVFDATLAAGVTTVDITGLTAALDGADYDVYVTSDCGYDITETSAVENFTTLPVPCDPVMNVSISDITATSAVVSWDLTATATEGYVVNVYETGTTTNPVATVPVNTAVGAVGISGLTGSTATNPKHYDVYVTTNCDFDVTISSDVETFKTEDVACDVVADVTISAITQNGATVSWTGVASAVDGYDIEVYESGTTSLVAVESVGAGVTTAVLTNLPAATTGTDYDVYVVTKCGYNGATVVSAVESFTTLEVTCDTVIASVDAFTQTTALVSWSASGTAVGNFTIDVYLAGDDPLSDTPVVTGTAAVSATDFLVTGLDPATNYEVYVTSDCDFGVETTSDEVAFTTESCDEVTNLQVSNETQTAATVTWEASATASEGYMLTLYEEGTEISTQLLPVSVLSFELTGLDPATTYEVMITSDCGEVTMDSALVEFTTESCDAATDVAISDITLTTATVSWTGSATASDGYEVNVYEAGTTNLVATETASASDTSASLTGLDAATAYDVVVTSDCGEVTMDAAAVSFTTLACDAVTDIVLSDITQTTATVTWTGSATASEGYVVNVFEAGTTNLVTTETAAAGETSVNLTGLDTATTYDVVITSDCDDVTVDSASVSFTTMTCDAVVAIAYNITQTTATVIWTPSATAEEYIITVTEGGTEVSSDIITGTSINLTGLLPATTYEVIVTSDCGDVTVDSNLVTINTMSCDAATDVEVTAYTQTTATVTWTASATASDGYEVNVYEAGTTNLVTTINASASDTSAMVTGLDANTAYDVVVTSDCGDVSMDSAPVSFTTDSCDAVTDVVISAITLNSATVTWTASATASDGYEVNVYEAGTTDLVTTETASASDTSAMITGLDANTAYDVVVTSDCGDMTVDSPPASFTTDAFICDAVSDVTISNVDSFTASVSWTGFAAANEYIVNVYEAGETAVIFTETVGSAITSVEVDDLDPDTDYEVYVTSDCGNGYTGISAMEEFTTLEFICATVADVTISNVDEFTASIGWTASARATGYTVEVYEAGESTVIFTDTVDAAVTSVEVIGLSPDTDYEVYVTSDCGNGYTGTSAMEEFTTIEFICATVTDVTISNVDEFTASVGWTASARATGYTVEVYEAGSSTAIFTDSVGSSITSVDVTGLSPDTDYEVYVISDCGNNYTGTSAVTNFTTDTLICDAVTDVVVSDLTETTANVSWTSSITANNGYVIEVYEEGTSDVIFTDSVGSSITSVDLTGLSPDTNYEVYVVSDCGSGNTTTSEAVPFTTEDSVSCDAVTDVVMSDIAQTTARVNWMASATATSGYMIEVYEEGGSIIIFTESVGADVTSVDITDLTPETTYEVYVTSDCGSGEIATSDVVSFTTEPTIGMDDFSSLKLTMYPNPVVSDLHLSASATIERIQVYTLLDQQVMTVKTNSSEVTLDMSRLSTATYILRVTVDGSVRTLKFVKK